MTDLQIFNSPEFGAIRTIEKDGEPWFVGKDVAAALGYEKPTDAVRKHVDVEDRGISKIVGHYCLNYLGASRNYLELIDFTEKRNENER